MKWQEAITSTRVCEPGAGLGALARGRGRDAERLIEKRKHTPEEGDLRSVHPGRERQAGVFSKWRDYHGEDQRHQHERRRQNNLYKQPEARGISQLFSLTGIPRAGQYNLKQIG